MSDSYNYRDAVLDDGRDVLYEVIKRLYQGDNLRPDIFFKTDTKLRRLKYNIIFNPEQQSKIEQSGMAGVYDIANGARSFDVSLLAPLIEYTCGLSPNDGLLEKVKLVKALRNIVAHEVAFDQSYGYQDMMELLKLYVSIIDELEEMTCENLCAVKRKVENVFRYERMQTSRQNHNDESDGMPTWGKVALGVTAGVAALGLAGALLSSNSNEDEEKRKREQRRNQTGSYGNSKEECIVM